MVGWMINGIVCWAIGRYAAPGRCWSAGSASERLVRYEDSGRAAAASALLIGVRAGPDRPVQPLLAMSPASARVPLGRFVWTTVVGYLPLTAVFAYLGSRLEELSLDDPLLWLGALAVDRACCC